MRRDESSDSMPQAASAAPATALCNFKVIDYGANKK